MTDDRILKLESDCCPWSLRCSQLKNDEIDQWDARFWELKEYKAEQEVAVSLEGVSHLAFGLAINARIIGC